MDPLMQSLAALSGRPDLWWKSCARCSSCPDSARSSSGRGAAFAGQYLPMHSSLVPFAEKLLPLGVPAWSSPGASQPALLQKSLRIKNPSPALAVRWDLLTLVELPAMGMVALGPKVSWTSFLQEGVSFPVACASDRWRTPIGLILTQYEGRPSPQLW